MMEIHHVSHDEEEDHADEKGVDRIERYLDLLNSETHLGHAL
jgi:hypothetical protein